MRPIALSIMFLSVAAFASVSRAADSASSAPASVDAFATNLYSHLPADVNLIWSPFSVYSAMAMTAEGARGKTAEELSAIFSAKEKNGLKQLTIGLNSPGGDFKLESANAIWAQTGFNLNPNFVDQLKTNYGAGCFNVDFSDGIAAARAINNWVSKQTSAKIPELFSPGSLPKQAALVLTNAIYFHGDWQMPFSPDRSALMNFHVSGHSDIAERMMMNQHASFPVMHGDDFDALEMPYKGDKLAMLIVLPRSIDGLKSLESKLSADFLSNITAQLKPQFVEVSIPKFTFTWDASLREPLQSIGITNAFDAGQADFSGMGEGGQRLFLSDVVHKAYISVDETGTEAAAATGGVMMPTAVPMPQTVFRADHPFFFAILDKNSGVLLFTGRVVDPQAK